MTFTFSDIVSEGFNAWWKKVEEEENIFTLPTIFSVDNEEADDYLEAVMEETNMELFRWLFKREKEMVERWVSPLMPADLPRNDSTYKYWIFLIVCGECAKKMVEEW